MKPTAKSISIGILRAIAVTVAVLILGWFLYKIKALFLFIGIAAVISLIARPIMLFLKSRARFSNTLATISTLIMVIAGLGLLIWIFVPIVIEQSKNIAEIDFDLVKSDLNELSIQASEYLGVEEINIVEAIRNSEQVKGFDVEVVPSFFDVFINNLGNGVVGLFAVLFISFFLIKDENFIPSVVTSFAKKGNERRFLLVFKKIKKLLSRYFIGLVAQVFILSVFYSIILLLFDIDNAIAIAIICAFLNIVPYLGPLIAGALMMLIVLSNNLGADFSSELVPTLGYVFIGYCLSQLFDNLITQPVIFGKSVKSHPLEIFIVILIGGFLFGISGMILAVPVYTALKVISKEFLSEYKIVQRLTKNL
jgi:predicted PurR-regulated permease PerM